MLPMTLGTPPPTVKHGSVNIIQWGVFFCTELLHPILIQILSKNLLPSARRLWVSQQDNDPKQTTKTTIYAEEEAYI